MKSVILNKLNQSKLIGRITVIIICTMMITLPNICAANIFDYPTIAVIPFHKKATVSADLNLSDEDIVSEIVNKELTNSGKFDVVDRAYLKETLDEQYLTMTGMIDQSTAAQIGQLLGAKYLVVGSITGLSSKNKSSVGGGTHSVIAHVYARMIEVETGRVVLAGSGDGISKNRVVKAPLRLIKIGTDEIDQEQVHEALKEASVNLVDDMLKAMDKRQGR